MGKLTYSNLIVPYPGESVGGDIAWVKRIDNEIILGLIDVAGHGMHAHELAKECMLMLDVHYQSSLKDIILTLHELLKGTRGLVMGLCSINEKTGVINYMGIGNIRARILGKQCYRFVSRAGVLGFSKPHPILETYLLNDNDIFLMYTDGVSDRFDKSQIPDLFTLPINNIPATIIHHFSKQADDAGCVAARFNYD